MNYPQKPALKTVKWTPIIVMGRPAKTYEQEDGSRLVIYDVPVACFEWKADNA
jgi:hypothetical protein